MWAPERSGTSSHSNVWLSSCEPPGIRGQGSELAKAMNMRIGQQLGRYAGRKLTTRLTRSLPWIGGAIALVTVGKAIRRKGFVGGAMHTTLYFIPFVGGLKNMAELVRGRDFFPDKPAFAANADRRSAKQT